MSIFCTSCGKENSEEDNFCIWCGVPLDKVTPVPPVTKPITSSVTPPVVPSVTPSVYTEPPVNKLTTPPIPPVTPVQPASPSSGFDQAGDL